MYVSLNEGFSKVISFLHLLWSFFSLLSSSWLFSVFIVLPPYFFHLLCFISCPVCCSFRLTSPRLPVLPLPVSPILPLYVFFQEHKVLLTGTPLQNTVEELFSLLHFLEPAQFSSETEFLRDFGDLKTEEQVQNMHWCRHGHTLIHTLP